MKTATVTNTMAKKTRPAELKLTTKAPGSNGSISSNGTTGQHSSNKKGVDSKKKMKSNKNDNNDSARTPDETSVVSSSSGESFVVQSQSPPWKKTFDYIADQAFNVFGAMYLFAMGAMCTYFMRKVGIDFFDELQSSIRLMMFHYYGIPFFGCLTFMVSLRWTINNYIYPIVLNRIYEGKNHKYTAHYCEWLFDAIKNTCLFSIGAYVAFGSDWWPVYTPGRLMWYPPQGGTIFDSNGEVVPTCALALETIGHFEVTVDFVALLTLCYDAITEYYEARAVIHHGDDNQTKQATTTTSFAEDFVHHSGVVFGALFLYITAKDNANAIAIIVLLGQFNDMCEFAALTLGLCKNWFFERVVTPILCVFWTISLFYIWPAALIPIFLEPIPIEISFDQTLVLQLTLYQIGSVFIASLFWAMHMFWLYKGLLFLYRYQRGVYFSERRMKLKNKDGTDADDDEVRPVVPMYGRTACLATGTVLKPTKEE